MASHCRYPKPKILLIDLPSSWTVRLQKAGYSAAEGTFGSPYKVKPSAAPHPALNRTANLPNYTEQEIVFLNTAAPLALDETPGDPGDGVSALWQAGVSGLIDPRPRTMQLVRDAFNQILEHGGAFVVFLSHLESIEYVEGASRFGHVEMTNVIKATNTSCLEELDSLQYRNETGEEFELLGKNGLANLLRQARADARYHCSMDTSWRKDWVVLARNKYHRPVAGMLHAPNKGIVLLLPQMPNMEACLVQFLQDGLAPLAPELFPHFERGAWQHHADYELPEILALETEMETIRAKAEAAVREKQELLLQLRADNSDYYCLLAGTGDELARVVVRVLQELCFERVVDVDTQTDPNARREDIQVLDRSPALVIDVKGVQGKPEDAECQQAEKHALIRVREWKRTDVQALTIINAERHLPPFSRTSEPFRKELVENALHMSSGLMTTLDLAIIWRNAKRLNWPRSSVAEVFYRTGRIYPVPGHYFPIGKLVKRWKHSVGVIPSRQIVIGARVSFYSASCMDYVEVLVESLRVDNVEVAVAAAGSNCGIAIPDMCAPKEGMDVFLVVDTERTDVT